MDTYIIEIRMKNPGVAKYLIEWETEENFTQAFVRAGVLLDKYGKDYFADVYRNDGYLICRLGDSASEVA